MAATDPNKVHFQINQHHYMTNQATVFNVEVDKTLYDQLEKGISVKDIGNGDNIVDYKEFFSILGVKDAGEEHKALFADIFKNKVNSNGDIDMSVLDNDNGFNEVKDGKVTWKELFIGINSGNVPANYVLFVPELQPNPIPTPQAPNK